VRLDLCFAVSDLLFGSGDSIGAREGAARRLFRTRNRDERSRRASRVP
jgi:hypothetical protein